MEFLAKNKNIPKAEISEVCQLLLDNRMELEEQLSHAAKEIEAENIALFAIRIEQELSATEHGYVTVTS